MFDQYIMPSYDWSSTIETIKAGSPDGSQILNFFSTDKHFSQNDEASRFVEEYLNKAKSFDIDAELMRYVCDQISPEGVIAEMGVCTGRTINFIAALNPRSTIYGFDSFNGLPEDWSRNDFPLPKGVFGYHNPDVPPPVLNNVCLVKGLFNETLPIFASEVLKDQPIALLHIDCDLYQSTVDIFNAIGHRLVKGSIVLFDELYNFPKWEEHEVKALHEFLNRSGKKVEYFAYNTCWEQVAVRFI